MLLKHLLTGCLFLPSFLSYSQKDKTAACENKINTLYNLYKEHIIFYNHYSENIRMHTGADTIYNYMPFYRDQLNVSDISVKDRQLLTNIKKYLCNENEAGLNSIETWCKASIHLKKIREQTEFTLDGYMSFLASTNKTMTLIVSYLVGDRTIDSFSTEEMENIYFNSIRFIASLTKDDQKNFYENLAKWDFTK